jgi:adenylate cyclase
VSDGSRRLGRHSVFVYSLLLATAVWAALQLAAGAMLSQMDERSGDVAWRLGADRRDERRLIVVDIDERSLREIGSWPWARPTQARLIQQLAALGARQQIFDIVFTDPQPGDDALAAAVHKHQTVMAQVFALEQGGQPSVGQPTGALDWTTCLAPFGSASGYLANFAGLQAKYTGHITPRVSGDGFVRHQPAVICHDGKSYPALGLAALMRATADRGLSLEPGIGLLDPPLKLSAPAFPLGPVPLDRRGDIRLSWRIHPESFVSVSASDVLAGRVPAGLLENAWVLVASSAFGLNDTIATPFAGASSGLQVHAQLITALIDGRIPYAPRGELAAQSLAAALGILMLFLLWRQRGERHRFPLYLLPVAAISWALLIWAGQVLLLLYGALWVGASSPALFVMLTGSAIGILEHARSRVDRDRLYAHLSSYLPARVAASLALQPPSSAIKASTNMVCVMFADIRNFSAYCEARPPDEAAAVLHAFFSTATSVVEAHGGVIEAFQGDAILAVWNGGPAPNRAGESTASRKPVGAVSDHAHQALQAAIRLQAAMHGVLPDPAPAGLEPLSLGIGVEAGPAMAGSFGLASRRTHMVMGRTVTIASRLVDMTAELAHPILVGEGLAAQVGGESLESMGMFLLDGMRVPHHIYAYPLQSGPAIP